ncbi:Chemotaxis protein methyltransferase [Sporotomaculum syntrophicum]|uniref:Chemotaxis protein methyltransferase n=1 Tax=Sporotomaculum syntrophicum TaxID=182264 RepID=A0A9D2WQT1_9FIRM|nr:protein-glutamate O-methyltransferase CheR [Sporotomaculum syntrophicum]KAF1085415.1 Chemotaxis protein methyltransferase [Sporotomaculum syntrophicum]
MDISKKAEQPSYDEQLEKIEITLLLEGIFQRYGFDFRNYVYSSMRRRIRHRIRIENLNNISALQEKVLHDQQAMESLFADFCIHVTEMFRDPGFFLALRTKILPLLKDKPLIRIWSAGCASGEEVFSMAILLLEEGLHDKTMIYATDMSSKIIEKAKQGVFPLSKMKLYTQNYINSGGTRSFSDYYKVIDDNAIFTPSLVRKVIYAQHNLASDESFNEFDIIICRNVLIYFNRVLQEKVHKLFYDSLCVQGFLGLGNKETLDFSDVAHCYDSVDIKEKIYRKYK